MKKSLYLIMMALLCVIGCQVQELENPENDVILEGDPIYAEIEQPGDSTATKTYIDQYRNVRFQLGDQITLFNFTTLGKKYQIEDAADGKTSGNFFKVKDPDEPIGGGTQTHLMVAYYPYISTLKLEYSNVEQTSYLLTEVNLPGTQLYDAEHITAQNSLPMVSATTEDNRELLFKNVCGILKLNIKGVGSIRKITLKGNNGELLSGAASISLQLNSNPSIIMDQSATTEVTLDCGETGVALNENTATQFLIAVPPTVFENGFTITVTDTNGEEMVMKTNNRKEISRSSILKMETFTYTGTAPQKPIPNNQIWYTSTDGKIVVPQRSGAEDFGANLISNEYKDGKGIMTFDGDVTMISRVYLNGKSESDGIFFECKTLNSIILPNTVHTIGDFAFARCKNLPTIELPETVTTLADGAFCRCSNLTSIYIPDNVPMIGWCAFQECYNLTNIHLPKGLKNIKDTSFHSCFRLKSLIIPDGVTNIGVNAFANCFDLEKLRIPDSVTQIGGGFINRCSNLVYIDYKYITQDRKFAIKDGLLITYIDSSSPIVQIPEGVKTIGKSAFVDNEILEQIIFPSTLERIEEDVFRWCRNFRTVYCKAEIPPTGSYGDIFGSNYSDERSLWVPESRLEVYRTAGRWKYYASQIFGYDFLSNQPKLNISKSNLKYSYIGGEASLFYYLGDLSTEAKSSVSIESSSDWISNLVANNGVLSFSIAKNTEATERIATITVRYEGAEPAILTIRQEAFIQPDLVISVNGVEIPLIKVEGGTFTMGETKEQGFSQNGDGKPTHQVTLSSYYIGQFKVSQELWKAVMGTTVGFNSERPLSAVNCISWNDITNEFLPKLNQLTGKNFVLPTEAQWEFAARGGNQSKGYMYSGSNNYDEITAACTKYRTIGQTIPNELGIYDMTGTEISEWCQDWFGKYTADAQVDPTGPTTGTERATRSGGRRGNNNDSIGVAERWHNSPDYSSSGNIGFRLALPL